MSDIRDEQASEATPSASLSTATCGERSCSDGAPCNCEQREPLAGGSLAAWLTLAVVFGVGLAGDLLTKSWAFATVAGRPVNLVYSEIVGNPRYPLPWHEGVRALPWDLLDFRLVLNHGAVFGVGQNRQRIFIGFTMVAATVALVFFARWTRANARIAHIAIGMILAGGIGNLYDRLTVGAVRDFLHMLPRWNLPWGLRWPNNPTSEVFPWIFNVADVLLLAGMAIFLMYAYRRERHAECCPTGSTG
jgi:signal peptidase II